MARINHALSSNGATIVASSTYNEGAYSGEASWAINSDRLFAGSAWNGAGSTGGIWHSLGAPANIVITFPGLRLVDEINVITARDSFTDKSALTLAETFSLYGVKDFTVEYWNGSAFVVFLTVTGNDKVWRKFTAADGDFTALSTTKLRFNCTLAGATHTRIMEFEAIGEEGGGGGGSSYMVLPTDLTENAFAENKNDYYFSSPLARCTLATTATALTLGMWTTIYDFNPNAAKCVAKVNGVYQEMADCAAAGANEDTITLPAGMKTVEITVGAQANPNGSGIIGTFLKTLSANAAFTIVPAATSGRKYVGIGDSIIVGGDLTYGLRDGWVSKFRAARPDVSLTIIGFGYGNLKYYADQTGGLDELAARIASVAPDVLIDILGTNDFGLQTQSAANFGVQKAALMDKVHAALPLLKYWAVTMTVRTDEAEKVNGFGALGAYRTAIGTAATARPSFTRLIDGTAILTTADLADTVHPSSAGHIKYADFWEAYTTLDETVSKSVKINFTVFPPLVSHIRLKRTRVGEPDLIRDIERTAFYKDGENLTDGATYSYSAASRKPWTDFGAYSAAQPIIYQE